MAGQILFPAGRVQASEPKVFMGVRVLDCIVLRIVNITSEAFSE